MSKPASTPHPGTPPPCPIHHPPTAQRSPPPPRVGLAAGLKYVAYFEQILKCTHAIIIIICGHGPYQVWTQSCLGAFFG